MSEVRRKLNVLPNNPEIASEEAAVLSGRFPSWLHRKLPKGGNLWETGRILNEKRLPTVCEEARCPNLLECWSKKTATFLTMGKECTRSCGFCSIDFSKTPKPLDKEEPRKVAESVQSLGLKHVVLTQVARDDLADGGAEHLAAIVKAIRHLNPESTVELLTSDFNGNKQAWDTILAAQPEIFNYNIETVRSLTPRVRHTATYERTLSLLSYAKKNRILKEMFVKSGLMVGLGETKSQVFETIADLKVAGCDIITIGQYLQATRKKLMVNAFVTPDEFKEYEAYGHQIGVRYMYAGPFVRSSYNAGLVFSNSKTISST